MEGWYTSIQVDILARSLCLEFSTPDIDSFDTGFLHRISSRIYLADWFGLVSIFRKTVGLDITSKNKMFFGGKETPKIGSAQMFPKVYLSKVFWGAETPSRPNI